MANMERIHDVLGPNVCRHCIRKYYKVNLLPDDCIYEQFPAECSCCGEMHNIVAGLTFHGSFKLFGKRLH